MWLVSLEQKPAFIQGLNQAPALVKLLHELRLAPSDYVPSLAVAVVRFGCVVFQAPELCYGLVHILHPCQHVFQLLKLVSFVSLQRAR